MPTDTLQDFVEARLRAYDPLIDLNTGSPAEEQVVSPIVRRFEPDPLEMSIEAFIDARLQQELPDMNISEGTGVRDFLVKPSSLLMDPVIREVQLIKQGQSLLNPELLADAEADALVANFFVSRNLGQLSTGKVRLYFNAPIALNITIGNVCYTADGLRFLPTTLQSISAEAMVFNQSGNLYYFDINVTAESAGSDYNIDKNTIIGITNLNVSVRATNLSKFSNGIIDEDTTSLIARAQQSITERSLVVPRGTIARLNDQFNALTQIQVIGNADPEMNRDIVVGGDLGAVRLSGNDGFAEDDGKGGTTTSKFKTMFGDFTTVLPVGTTTGAYLITNEMSYGLDGTIYIAHMGSFVSLQARFTEADVGSLLVVVNATHAINRGTFKIISLITADTVTLEDSSGNTWVGVAETGMTWLLLRGQKQFGITEVVSTKELLVDAPMPSTSMPLAWSIRKKELTLSNIPGGILFGAAANSIPSDEVHIGGCTDFYVRGTDVTPQSLALSAIQDELPLVESGTGSTDNSDLPHLSNSFLFDPAVNFVTTGVLPGMPLVVKSGVNAGTYKIARVGFDILGNTAGPLPAHYVQVDVTGPLFSDVSPVSGIQYTISSEITIDLVSPHNTKGAGNYGQTAQLSLTFTTADLIDFVALGASVGDTLHIKEGLDEGDYTITGFSGTGNRNLILSRPTTSTATALGWQIYAAATGIQLPLVRVTSVNLLDGSNQPTGNNIPYSEPVDARSSTFSNTGHGVKLSVVEATVGIVGTINIEPSILYPLAANTITIMVNKVPRTVTLTGAIGAADVVNKINAVWPNIADTLIEYVGQEPDFTRLILRSSDRWIKVTNITGSVNLGLVIGDDNRQIKADAVIWNNPTHDLRVGVDSISLTTGNDVGRFYLVSVEAGRILAVSFTESEGAIRFINPGTGVALTIGSRSTGTARVYFLDPTSFEVHGGYRPALKSTTSNPANCAVKDDGSLIIATDEPPISYFSTDINGSVLRFLPDPGLDYTVVPAPGVRIPSNLTLERIDGTSVYDAESVLRYDGHGAVPQINFPANGVRVGDTVNITYQPVQGTYNIGDALIANPNYLVGKDFIFKVDGALKKVVFPAGATDPAAVLGVINDAAGVSIAAMSNYIIFEADVLIEFIGGTAAGDLYFGLNPLNVPTSNKSYAADAGPYTVKALTWAAPDITNPYKIQLQDSLGQPPPFPPDGRYSNISHHFTVSRSGVQRIHTTLMNAQTENGLYYMDVELLSDGSGDVWNIPENLVFLITDYKSDGYRLVVADPNLSYSMLEQVKMILSNSILAIGQSDSPLQAITLSGQNIQVNYENSALVSSIQDFATADLDRVLTASILVRHLQPAYVNFNMSYTGGSDSSVVQQDVLTYLAALTPNERVESSAIQDKANRRGATFVTNPITLLAISHDEHRNIIVERSTNFVSHSRLSTFFPGIINISSS
jgi:hypothetical protein